MKATLVAWAIFFCTCAAWAQEASAIDTSFQRFGGLPALAYAEETGLQYGALVMMFFKPIGPRDPGSQADFAVIFTTKNQKRVVLSPQIALWNGKLRFEPELQYRDWPGFYWGSGNTPTDSSLSYNMTQWQLEGDLQAVLEDFSWLPQLVQKHVELGFEYDFEKNRTKFNPHPALDSTWTSNPYPTASTSLGGNRMGLGWNVKWDSRDHDNWPRHGSMAWVRQVYFSKALGSDWDFMNTKVDLRTFLPTPLGGAWGMCAYWEGVRGDVPFDRLSQPDGTYHLRGLIKGMLRDREQAVLQGEWRVPLFWRFSAASFVEAGTVGSYFSKLWENSPHYVVGLGGRMALNVQRKVNVRGDLSLVDGHHLGLTIYYKEAF